MSRAEQAGKHILSRMQNELASNIYYHNVSHVVDVVSAAERIGIAEKINPAELELLKVAALYHDCGFIIEANNHEKHGCEIAQAELPGFGFSSDEINVICDLIMATKIPQSPKNLLEQIICDADLDYLGRDDFFTIGAKIFEEFKSRNLINNERDWNELQVNFLSHHNYFTATSISSRKAKKDLHIQQIKKLLQNQI